MQVYSFWQKVTYSAYGAGIFWLFYAYYFILSPSPLLSSIFLTLAGLLSAEVAVGLYLKLKEVNEGWALVALLLTVAGALGTAVHGAYDLANVIHPPLVVNRDLPNMVDPRGFLAFLVTGIGLIKFSYLAWASKKLDQNLSLVGLISGVLLVVIYLGRLIVLSPAAPILKYPVLLEGFIVNPLWYLWLGMSWGKKN